MPLLAVVALAAPANAKPPLEIVHYTDTGSFTDDSCAPDLVLHGEFTFSGLFKAKPGPGDTAPALIFDNYSGVETITASGPGGETSDRVLTIEHNGLFKFTSVTAVPGEPDIYQVTAMESGQPFVVRDESGAVLIRDRGVLRTTFQVDSLGDDDPLSWEFVEGSFELLEEHGRHEGFFLDFCAFVEDYFFGA
ncbi:hypothetical protein ACI797_01260 [Geodermatophilus sp. SYSU D00691]